MDNATHLNLINRIEEPSGLSVGMFCDSQAYPIEWGQVFKAEPASAAGPCLHAGCHPGRCVYGPDHGIRPEPAGLPQANVTGPCQIQSSILCTGEGIQRMNPLDMLATDTAFRDYVSCCLPCYEANSDEFVRVSHGRA